MNDVAVDAHPEAGAIQGEDKTNADGMSIEDAATSAYDDFDRRENGIAEGERVGLGQHLKGHADAAGTTVIGGLNTLIDSAVGLRTGDQATRRQVIGDLIDNYDVRAEPTAEPAPTVAPVVTEEQAMGEVADFIAANPIAQDEKIQDATIYHLNNMQRQGFPPDLRVAFNAAVANDARYSQQGQAEADAATVARARAAAVQVSGGGHTAPRGGSSDEIADILNEMIP